MTIVLKGDPRDEDKDAATIEIEKKGFSFEWSEQRADGRHDFYKNGNLLGCVVYHSDGPVVVMIQVAPTLH